MTGHEPGPRTRRDAIRDWMVLAFALAVTAAVAGALFAAPRLFAVAAVFAVTSLVLAAAYWFAGGAKL